MARILNNRTLYESYFAWRIGVQRHGFPPTFLQAMRCNFGERGNLSSMCRLCRLYDKELRRNCKTSGSNLAIDSDARRSHVSLALRKEHSGRM